MSVRRTRSVSKWKEILGFDERSYPTSPTSSSYRYESPESINESAGSLSPTVSYYHETLEELTPKKHYSDAPESQRSIPSYYKDDPQEVPTTQSHYHYSDAPEAVYPTQPYNETLDELAPAENPYSDAPEAVFPTPLYDDGPEVVPYQTPLDYSYSDAPEVVPSPPVDIKSSVSSITSRFNTSYPASPTPTYSTFSSLPNDGSIRFPRDLTFTRNSSCDIILSSTSPLSAQNEPSAPPLFYITISQTPSSAMPASSPSSTPSRPDIALHCTASPLSPLLAFASFNNVTLITDITTLPPPSGPSPLSPLTLPPGSSTFVPPPTTYLPNDSLNFGVRSQGYKTEKLVPTGGIFTSERYAFNHTLPRTFVKEKFEWRQISSSSSQKHSKARDDIDMDKVPEEMTSKKGGVKMKLVRCSTGETIAVYVGVGNEDWADKERRRRPRKERGRTLGMMRWVELEGGSLGEEFELMGLMSVLGVMERWRRVMNVQKQLGMFTS